MQVAVRENIGQLRQQRSQSRIGAIDLLMQTGCGASATLIQKNKTGPNLALVTGTGKPATPERDWNGRLFVAA